MVTRRNTALRLSAAQQAALAERADLEGVNVSEIIRRAVDAYLGLPTGDVRRHLADGLAARLIRSIDEWKGEDGPPEPWRASTPAEAEAGRQARAILDAFFMANPPITPRP